MAQASLWSVSFYVDGLKKKISSVCAILVVQSKLSKSNVDSMNITLVMPHRVTNTRAGRNHKVHVPISYSYMCKELPGRLVKEITEYHVASWCQGWTGSHLSGRFLSSIEVFTNTISVLGISGTNPQQCASMEHGRRRNMALIHLPYLEPLVLPPSSGRNAWDLKLSVSWRFWCRTNYLKSQWLKTRNMNLAHGSRSWQLGLDSAGRLFWSQFTRASAVSCWLRGSSISEAGWDSGQSDGKDQGTCLLSSGKLAGLVNMAVAML